LEKWSNFFSEKSGIFLAPHLKRTEIDTSAFSEVAKNGHPGQVWGPLFGPILDTLLNTKVAGFGIGCQKKGVQNGTTFWPLLGYPILAPYLTPILVIGKHGVTSEITFS